MSKVVTGKIRFSYVRVFEATSMDGIADPKYSVCVIVDKKDKVTLGKIQSAINDAKELGKSKNWGGKIPGNVKTPLRDGDVEREDKPEFAGKYFFNCSTKTRPQVVDASRNEILDKDEFYSGCYGRVSVNFYPFDFNGSKGVAAGLNNCQKLEDGENLTGRTTAEDDFSDDDDVLF
jgi:hypothetical protein